MDEITIFGGIVMACVTGGLSAVLSSFLTVAALKVHITYLRESVVRLDKDLARVHTRIDLNEHNPINNSKA